MTEGRVDGRAAAYGRLILGVLELLVARAVWPGWYCAYGCGVRFCVGLMTSMFGRVCGKRVAAHAISPLIVAAEATAVVEDKTGRGPAPRSLANPPVRHVAAVRPKWQRKRPAAALAEVRRL